MSDYGEFCRAQRQHRRTENQKWKAKRLASITKNAAAMGLEVALRDGEDCARLSRRQDPNVRIDWYLGSGKTVSVDGKNTVGYARDLVAVALMLGERSR